MPAAIDFQAAHDSDSVRARCHDLAATAAREVCGLLGTEPLAASADEYVQMVTLRLAPCDPEEVGARLLCEHRIEVLAQEWRGMPTLRLSFQGYNDERDLDVLLDALPRVP